MKRSASLNSLFFKQMENIQVRHILFPDIVHFPFSLGHRKKIMCNKLFSAGDVWIARTVGCQGLTRPSISRADGYRAAAAI